MHDHQQSTRDAPTAPAKKPLQDQADTAAQTIDKDKDEHQEDLLDEGIEESFPRFGPGVGEADHLIRRHR